MLGVTQKLSLLAPRIAAIALLAGCSSGIQSASQESTDLGARLAYPTPPSLLVEQQVVNQERRCSYVGQRGQFYTAVRATESCPAEYAHAGELWDAVSRRP